MTLETLSSIPSRRTEKIGMALLRRADELEEDKIGVFRGETGRGRAGGIAVDRKLRVIKPRTRGDRENPDEGRDDMVETSESLRRELRERQVRSFRHEETEVISWRQMLNRKRRIALLAEPGGGKSFSTRLEIARRLKKLGNEILSQDRPTDLDFVLWGKASELASIDTSQQSPQDFRSLFFQQCFNEDLEGEPIEESWSSLITIDGLDELSEREGFEHNIAKLAEQFPGTIIVTCRTGPWEHRSSWIPHRGYGIACFEPLGPPEQIRVYDSLAEALGKAKHADRSDFQSLMRQRSFIGTDLGTPLLCCFAAKLHLEKRPVLRNRTDPVHPAELYSLIVDQILNGDWLANPPTWCHIPDEIDSLRNQLSLAAWQLFKLEEYGDRNGNSPRNFFTREEFRRSGLPSEAVTKLLRVGLIVDAGKDGSRRDCLAFAHRTLLEYLAAEGLAADDNREGDLEKIVLTRSEKLEDSIYWLRDEWEPVLGFLNRLLPERLRERMEAVENRDDMFDSVWSLRKKLGFAVSYSRGFTNWGLEGIISLQKSSIPDIRQLATEALGNFDSDNAAAALIESLRDEVDMVRFRAVQGLGYIGSNVGLDALLGILNNDNSLDNREAAVESLGSIGGDRAAEILCEFLNDEEIRIRAQVAKALGETKSKRALYPLISALDDDGIYTCAPFQRAGVSAYAAEALAEIGLKEAIPPLLKKLHKPVREFGYDSAPQIASALAKLGGIRAINGLIAALDSSDFEIRRAAIWALGEVKDDFNLNVLFRALFDDSSYIRSASESSLSDILSPFRKNAEVRLYLKNIREKESLVPRDSNLFVAFLHSEDAETELLRLTSNEDPFIKIDAARAIGGVSRSIC